MSRRRTRIATSLLVVGGGWAGAWAAAPYLTTGTPVLVPEVMEFEVDGSWEPLPEDLRVMSVNAAHGRGNGRHQLVRRRRSLEHCLDELGTFLAQQSPAVVALQEIDGPSVWSRSFDHFAYLAPRAGYPYGIHGRSIDGLGLSYGAGLLSHLPMQDPAAITFTPSTPTWSKGFVVATVEHQGRSVDVVSVHLDFARSRVRRRQVDELIAHLGDRGRPVVVMGDLNSQWTSPRSPVRRLADGLELHTWRPEDPDLISYPKWGMRLDWILASRELEFAHHAILPDVVSDHRTVIADLRWARD